MRTAVRAEGACGTAGDSGGGGSSPLHPAPSPLACVVKAVCAQSGAEPPGACVLYWMRAAVRAEENPALDVARAAAAARGAPLLVAAFLLGAHAYPTARRWVFWLEGLRDAQRALRRQVPPGSRGARGGSSPRHACTDTCCLW